MSTPIPPHPVSSDPTLPFCFFLKGQVHRLNMQIQLPQWDDATRERLAAQLVDAEQLSQKWPVPSPPSPPAPVVPPA
jgi:hypothetical protein